VKCFFFAALIFCEHGVMRLSVGETKLGLLCMLMSVRSGGTQ
jgi:hypothetical protein